MHDNDAEEWYGARPKYLPAPATRERFPWGMLLTVVASFVLAGLAVAIFCRPH